MENHYCKMSATRCQPWKHLLQSSICHSKDQGMYQIHAIADRPKKLQDRPVHQLFPTRGAGKECRRNSSEEQKVYHCFPQRCTKESAGQEYSEGSTYCKCGEARHQRAHCDAPHLDASPRRATND